MADIWDRAITRGMVIEGVHLLTRTLVPYVLEGLMHVYDVADTAQALEMENRRRGGRKIRGGDLLDDVRGWSIHSVEGTIGGLWSQPKTNKQEQRSTDPGKPQDRNTAELQEPAAELQEPERKNSFQHYFENIKNVSNVSAFRNALWGVRDARDLTAHPETQVIERGYQVFESAATVLTLLRDDNALKFQEYLAQLSTIIAGGFRNRSLLEERYPGQYNLDFENAEELWILGTNLQRIVANKKLKQIRQILSRNGSVRILMHRPAYQAACKFAMIQEGLNDWGGYCLGVRNNLLKFFELRAEQRIGQRLEIRTINYMLAFGLDVMNADNQNAGSAVYLRMYPLPPSGLNNFEDQPVVMFRPNDGRWYDFFKDQF